MAESYKVKIKYDNTEIKKVGQMGELRRHKTTVQLTRTNSQKKPLDPERTCLSAGTEARPGLESKKMRLRLGLIYSHSMKRLCTVWS